MFKDKDAFEILQNYPDYNSEWIRCKKWGYNDGIENLNMEFVVEYPDNSIAVETVKHSDLPSVVFSMRELAHKVIDGKLGFYGYEFNDLGTYDAIVLDAVMQLYFFGEVVYG